jgi:hypothetical protein
MDGDVVAGGDEGAHDAAQEMGVAMIPAGDEGMSEIDDFHG